MSWSSIGVANSGLGWSILGFGLIRSYFLEDDFEAGTFWAIFAVPCLGLAFSYFHTYYEPGLRRTADFWMIVCPIIWLSAALFYWVKSRLKRK